MHPSRLSPAPLASFFAGALTVLATLLSGCGAAHIATAADPGVALTGPIFGGQQPVVDALSNVWVRISPSTPSRNS